MWRKRVSQAMNVLLGAIVVLVILILLLTFVGIKPYLVVSGSMEPNILTGSLCWIDSNVPYEKIKIGDVVALELKNGSLVTHRVIAVTEEGIETKGDANTISDGISTTQDNYVGKTILSIPYLGYLIHFFQQTKVQILFITMLINWILLQWCWQEWKKDKANEVVLVSEEKGAFVHK